MAGAWQVTADDLVDVATALRYEEDGMRLRRALAKELRTAVQPAVEAAKGQVLSMGSAGLSHAGEPLRSAVAGNVKAEARLTGKAAGVRVRVRTKGMPRGFRNAPRRLNRAGGWRHPVFGDRERWVNQVGKPYWFDGPMREGRERYRAAIQKVVVETADRIRRGAR